MIYRQNDPSRASNRTNDAMHPVGNDENHGVDSQASRHSHVDKTEYSPEPGNDKEPSELKLRSKFSFPFDPHVVEKKHRVLKCMELRSSTASDTGSSTNPSSSKSTLISDPERSDESDSLSAHRKDRHTKYSDESHDRSSFADSPSNAKDLHRSIKRDRHSYSRYNVDRSPPYYRKRESHRRSPRDHSYRRNKSPGYYSRRRDGSPKYLSRTSSPQSSYERKSYTHLASSSSSHPRRHHSRYVDYYRTKYGSREHSPRKRTRKSEVSPLYRTIEDRTSTATYSSRSCSSQPRKLSRSTHESYRYRTKYESGDYMHSRRSNVYSPKERYTRGYKRGRTVASRETSARRSPAVYDDYRPDKSRKSSRAHLGSPRKYIDRTTPKMHYSSRALKESESNTRSTHRYHDRAIKSVYRSPASGRLSDNTSRVSTGRRHSRVTNERQSLQPKGSISKRHTWSQHHDDILQDPPMKKQRHSPTLNDIHAQFEPPAEFCIYDSLKYFKDIKKIGEGAFGKVYKAILIRNNTIVALKKVIERKHERNKACDNIFSVPNVRELMSLTQLRHKNILQLRGVVSFLSLNSFNQLVPSQYYMLEYMDYDLSSLLQHGDLAYYELQHIKCMAKQLFCGLAFIHDQNFIHRDIKSGNVLLNTRGELKIADFGFACPVPGSYGGGEIKPLTNRVCTIFYRPLELLLGAIEYGKEVDMWGAGCIFAEMFLRIPLFRTRSGSEIDQVVKIRKICGPISEDDWLAYSRMKNSWAGFFGFLKNSNEPRLLESYLLSRAKLVTKAAVNLVSQLLDYSPSRRLSAKSCLEHPFFTAEHPPASKCSEIPIVEGELHEYDGRERKRLEKPYRN